VIREISDKWGKTQTLTGPVLILPYYEIKIIKEEEYKTRKLLYVLPKTLEINGKINPEIRYRGIYKVIVYGSDLDFNGKFKIPDLDKIGIVKENVDWENANIVFGLNDLRGIQNEINIVWKGINIPVDPGIANKTIAPSGFTAKVPITEIDNLINFKINLDLNGSQGLYFTPVGKTTNVKLSSDWSTPSFSGSFLPDSREISKEGFEAHWTVLHLNRNYPQHWIDGAHSLVSSSLTDSYQNSWEHIEQGHNTSGSTFGVNLLFPVDEYQKTMRSAKYAIMFISLTFLIYLFIEILNKKRIHPVQYLLVSFGLLLFYTLLLSLSEQIGFNLAYLISGLAIIGLITSYSHSIFKKMRLSLITSLSLTVLYIFLFVILQMEDYSLLLGSIGLFIILAFVMYLSKQINWYGGLENNKHETEPKK
jgi:inner membrane protein